MKIILLYALPKGKKKQGCVYYCMIRYKDAELLQFYDYTKV